MNAERKLVSVGVLSYNRPEGILRTLSCITNQTYTDLEIIVSDNCSPDKKTTEIITSFASADKRISCFFQETNIGAASNFQFVLSKATGDYFMWAADDDEWEPGFIEACLYNMKNGGAAMSNVKWNYRVSGLLIESRTPCALSANESTFNNLIEYLNNVQPSLFYGVFKRENLLHILDENFYDFYDLYCVMRQIVNHGYNTFPEILYTAGVDTEYYVNKPLIPRKGKVFTYFPFLRDGSRFIISFPEFTFRQKAVALIFFIRRILILFVNNEKDYQPVLTKINLSLLQVIEKLILLYDRSFFKRFVHTKTIKYYSK